MLCCPHGFLELPSASDPGAAGGGCSWGALLYSPIPCCQVVQGLSQSTGEVVWEVGRSWHAASSTVLEDGVPRGCRIVPSKLGLPWHCGTWRLTALPSASTHCSLETWIFAVQGVECHLLVRWRCRMPALSVPSTGCGSRGVRAAPGAGSSTEERWDELSSRECALLVQGPCSQGPLWAGFGTDAMGGGVLWQAQSPLCRWPCVGRELQVGQGLQARGIPLVMPAVPRVLGRASCRDEPRFWGQCGAGSLPRQAGEGLAGCGQSSTHGNLLLHKGWTFRRLPLFLRLRRISDNGRSIPVCCSAGCLCSSPAAEWGAAWQGAAGSEIATVNGGSYCSVRHPCSLLIPSQQRASSAEPSWCSQAVFTARLGCALTPVCSSSWT